MLFLEKSLKKFFKNISNFLWKIGEIIYFFVKKIHGKIFVFLEKCAILYIVWFFKKNLIKKLNNFNYNI